MDRVTTNSPPTPAIITRFFLLLFVLLLQLLLATARGLVPEGALALAQAVFISCNKQYMDQSYWELIASTVDQRNHIQRHENPGRRVTGGCIAAPPVDALVWLGDAIYADNYSRLWGCFPNSDMEIVRSKFVQQRNAPEYVAFRRSCVRRRLISSPHHEQGESQRVIGVWDDHDMGKNDGGAEYVDKDTVQQLYLDFLGVGADDYRRKQQGLYSLETVPFEALWPVESSGGGGGGAVSVALKAMQRFYDNAMCFVLLDLRYFRDPANATYEGDMLGKTQWMWLEERLQDSIAGRNPITGRERCALTVVGSGVQIIMDDKVSENWGAFPRTRDRLFTMLRRRGTERVLFLSGDVHLGEIGMDSSRDAIRVLGYPIVEATSSGLTHSAASFIGLPTLIKTVFPTPRRVGVYVERNFGVLQLTADLEGLGRLLTGMEEVKREHLEAHANVSITIHSIAEQGRGVLRLVLPLNALTYRSGCRFFKTKVDPSGYVVQSPAVRKHMCDNSLADELGGWEGKPEHRSYPFSTPQPALTYTLRVFQHYIWPDHTLSQVLFDIVYTGLVVVLLFLLLSLLRTAPPCFRCRRVAFKQKHI